MNKSIPENELFADVSAHHVGDFCDRFGISRQTFWKYARAGKIKTFRIGRRVLVPHSELSRIAAEGVK